MPRYRVIGTRTVTPGPGVPFRYLGRSLGIVTEDSRILAHLAARERWTGWPTLSLREIPEGVDWCHDFGDYAETRTARATWIPTARGTSEGPDL